MTSAALVCIETNRRASLSLDIRTRSLRSSTSLAGQDTSSLFLVYVLETLVAQKRTRQMPHPKCFHNGIVLIVICFKLVTQR